MSKYDKINGFDAEQLPTNVPHTTMEDKDLIEIIRIKYNVLRDKQIKSEFTKGVIRGLWLALSILGEADYSEEK